MLANGANPDELDEDTFREACVMYADGQIGNQGLLELIGSLTTAVYNYLREPNKPAYKLQDVMGKRVYEYLYPPQDKKEAVNEALSMFVTRAKGFDPKRFKGG